MATRVLFRLIFYAPAGAFGLTARETSKILGSHHSVLIKLEQQKSPISLSIWNCHGTVYRAQNTTLLKNESLRFLRFRRKKNRKQKKNVTDKTRLEIYFDAESRILFGTEKRHKDSSCQGNFAKHFRLFNKNIHRDAGRERLANKEGEQNWRRRTMDWAKKTKTEIKRRWETEYDCPTTSHFMHPSPLPMPPPPPPWKHTHVPSFIFESKHRSKSRANKHTFTCCWNIVRSIAFAFTLRTLLCAHVCSPLSSILSPIDGCWKWRVTPFQSFSYRRNNMPIFLTVARSHAIMSWMSSAFLLFYFACSSLLFYFVNCWKTNLFCNVVILFVAIRNVGVTEMFALSA